MKSLSAGFRPNADVTIFAAQGNDAALVNVKASNPEGLGALGRREGMAAAIVLPRAD